MIIIVFKDSLTIFLGKIFEMTKNQMGKELRYAKKYYREHNKAQYFKHLNHYNDLHGRAVSLWAELTKRGYYENKNNRF